MELSFDQFLEVVESAFNQEQSPDAIQEANNLIYEFREKSTQQFLIYSAEIILLENVTDKQATIAINFIKSVLKQSRYIGIDYIIQIWDSIPEEQRMQLKQALIRGIMFQDDKIRNSFAATLAIILKIEFPERWPDFFDVIVTLCQDQSYGTSSVLGVIKTLGDAFMSHNFIRPRYTEEREKALNVVRSLVFQVLEQDVDVSMKIEAVNMFTNSINTTFFRNFRGDPDLVEKSFQNILGNFEIENEKLHDSIYDFFLMIFKKVDDLYPHPITEIAQAITQDLQSGNLQFQKAALSFMTKCAKEEQEFSIEKKRKREMVFTQTCSENFTELILPFLAAISDSYDGDGADDSLSCYALQTLKSFASFDEENVLSNVMEYFEQFKENEDHKIRSSSVIALKSVLKTNLDIEKAIWPCFSDIVNLAQDQNILVRLYSQDFIASYIKKNFLMDDRNKEIQFIVEFATELLQQDIQQAIEGCKVLTNFIKRYQKEDISTPLGDEEVFGVILKSLWSQVDRPEILEPKFYDKVRKAIRKLCMRSPYPTIEIRKDFCVEIFTKFRDNAGKAYDSSGSSQELGIMQNLYLDLFGSAIYSIQGLFTKEENLQFVDEVFEFLYQFLPRMEEIPYIIKAIGDIILAVPMNSQKYADALAVFLAKAQKSQNFELITESAITTGDLFRAAPDVMREHSDTFCELLLDNIENDNIGNGPVCNSIMTLADVVRYSKPEKIIEYRDRLMAVVRNYTHIVYNPDDPNDIEMMKDFFTGIIYLAGAILKVFSEDGEFIKNKENIDILFEFRQQFKPELFHSVNMSYTIILFLDLALSNPYAAREYNTYLNHYNIKNYLMMLKNSKKPLFAEKAKKLYSSVQNA